jgi:hypothetical protein
MLLNSSMVMRSVSKNKAQRSGKAQRRFKRAVRRQWMKLCGLMDAGHVSAKNIRDSIKRLVDQHGVTYGQAQKAMNVVLKYHYYLTHRGNDDPEIKGQLDCPIDSGVFKELGEPVVRLSRLKDRNQYVELQERIAQRSGGKPRVCFDDQWDRALHQRHFRP